MTTPLLADQLPSVAVFGPQSKTPTDKYLTELRSYIRSKPVLRPFIQAIRDLPKVWPTLLSFHPGFASLADGPRYLQTLSDWISGDGNMNAGAEVPSGILALPLLMIIHLAQYFQFLDLRGLKHHEMMDIFRRGAGVQGYCGGMWAAVSVACASDEEEIVTNACQAIRAAVGVGASCDVVDDNPLKLSCIMVVRTKRAAQAEEICAAFPNTYISAITDARTVSIVGPPNILPDVEKFCIAQKLTVQMIPLRGKVHDPENRQLALDFSKFCAENQTLRIPDASRLLVPFRSNVDAQMMIDGSLCHEIARTILAEKCEWYQLLTEVAMDLNQGGLVKHSIAAFGIGDCVSLKPFRDAGLQMTKLDMFSLIHFTTPSIPSLVTTAPEPAYSSPVEFSPDAIAVVGMACRFPGANSVEELWDVISSGRNMVQEVPKDRINFKECFRSSSDLRWASKQKFYGNFISDHDCFDNSFFRVSSKEATYMDPQQCLLLETAYQAMESSGYLCSSQSRDAGDRVGVFIGASFIDHLEHTSAQTPNAYTATGTITAFLSGKISHHFGWTGPSEVIDTACSSSLVAISRACRSLQRKECTAALVGGVNFLSTTTQFLNLGRAGFLSSTGQCKPFDISADGYCRSEGCGLIVLKPLSEAIANNDQIFGVIPGVATNQGSDSKSITVPHTISQLQLYKDILDESKIDPSLITYVEAHGTGTQVGDPVEIEGIRKAFASSKRDHTLHLGSIKANIGHVETAAGVAGVIKAILMVNKGVVPPLADFKLLNPKIPALEPDNMAIPTSAQPWNAPYKAIIVNGYGAAGSNAALLLCQSPQKIETSAASLPGAVSTFPVILSASSKKSLSAYARSLKRYLQDPIGPSKSIGDLAFTLSKCRKSQRFAWTSTAQDIPALCRDLDDLSSVSELPENAKPVVLSFSGQAKQAVSLDKRFYDSSPLFRKHLDQCNKYLMDTGSPSIFPGIFETQLQSDVVLLQCSMFALQYSCAKSWIDCGLKVDAVIGHSFGELTAMAVAGVMSVESTIDIVRARAQLIQSKWGAERGTMLAIHASESIVRDVISHLPPGSEVEIACYNSQASHVVVGSTNSIADIEYILRNNASFSSLRTSKPDTTHGFHSRFTDNLLDDLDEVARKQTFKSPQIPLEPCTGEQLGEIAFQRISQHMREPVFFYQAVQRIEKRLGSCIWLEAGVDSPIIPMIKKAVSTTQDHVFVPVKLSTFSEPAAAISDATIKLWREGVSVSFFNFQASGLQQIWLPPYEFERTKTWLPFIDRVTEALKVQQQAPVIVASNEPEKVALKLVNPYTDDGHTRQYRIGTETERFQTIVTGHNVITHPLCPAALYLECAIMAAQSTMGSLENVGTSFWDFRIDAPLGIDHSKTVLLALQGDAKSPKWSFTLKSSSEGSSKATLHAKANFKFFNGFTGQEASQFQYHQRFVKARMANFAANPDAETFKINRAYKLFSRVVNYAAILQGISSITMSGNEAMAELVLPAASETEESTAIGSCDTIALDNFVQVVGILINSSDLCTPTDAYLAVGADNLTIAPGSDLVSGRKYRVYASFYVENAKATGDIFVLDPNGTLVSTITGMHFHKLPLTTLHKILEPITKEKNGTRKMERQKQLPAPRKVDAVTISAAPVQASRSVAPVALKAKIHTEVLPSRATHPHTPPQIDLIASLKKVVAEFAGLAEDQISSDALIGDFGVDSLAAIELVDELRSQFSIEIESSDVITTNIQDLSRMAPHVGTQVTETKPPTPIQYATTTSSSSSVMTPSSRPSSPASSLSSNPSLKSSGLQDNLFKLIAEYAAIEASSITTDATLDVLGVDSLSLIELKSAVEESYGTELDLDLTLTVGGLLSMLGHSTAHITEVQSPIPIRAAVSVSPPSQPVKVVATQTPSSASQTVGLKDDILKLIAEHAAIDASSIVESASLDVLGVDSLSLIELKSALEETYDTELDLDLTVTVGTLLSLLGQPSSMASSPSVSQETMPKTSTTSNFIQQPTYPKVKQSASPGPDFLRDPVEALDHCQVAWTPTADHYGLTGYWENVVPKQDELVVAYVVEAFEQLGVNWRGLRQGEIVPTFQYSPKHNKVVPQLWAILEDVRILSRRGTQFLRSSAPLPSVHSSDLLEKLLVSCPTFANDSKLFSLTGSHLAKCLTGEEDAVPILFGSATNRTILNNFYQNSPLFKVSTDLLVILMDQVVPTGNSQTPIRILEVGAGTGGTTAQLCEFLQSQNRVVEYTFTDISSTLVGAAKKKFSTQFPWMDFCTLDLEKDAPFNLQGKYDIVIGTNVVHATSNIVNSCTRIRSLLRNNGFVVLLELTRMQKYFDLVFGLLSGWWSAKDGRAYPLQPAEVWSGYLRQAGFKSFGCTTGPAEESRIQQLLVGSLKENGVSGNRYDKAIDSKSKSYETETVPYKIVDDLRIEADIYYPMAQYRSSKPMPIALMLHGGGYMTLSRRAIRPYQTQHLLNNNFLPISLDYRLCPEVDALSGPITDIRDALIWARDTLPLLAKQKGVVVDVEKLVMVGWSTGGHLAMTTAWTSVNAGIKPPCAILSFYAPTDFENDHWTRQDIGEYAPRSMSMEKIQKALSQKVISNYDGPKGFTGSEKNLGFLQPGDPRSELVLSLFQDGNGLSLLLNGLPSTPSNPHNTKSYNPTPPTLSQIQSFSPLSQVQLGVYKTPTFIIHGTKDEVVPFIQGEAFIAELKERGIKCGGIFVQGKRHIFDAALRPGMEGWDKWIAPGYEFFMGCL